MRKICQYMSMNSPVVMTQSPFNKNIMGHYKFDIYTDPDNTGEIAAAFNLLGYLEAARQIKEIRRGTVKTGFNWNMEDKKLSSTVVAKGSHLSLFSKQTSLPSQTLCVIFLFSCAPCVPSEAAT